MNVRSIKYSAQIETAKIEFSPFVQSNYSSVLPFCFQGAAYVLKVVVKQEFQVVINFEHTLQYLTEFKCSNAT